MVGRVTYTDEQALYILNWTVYIKNARRRWNWEQDVSYLFPMFEAVFGRSIKASQWSYVWTKYGKMDKFNSPHSNMRTSYDSIRDYTETRALRSLAREEEKYRHLRMVHNRLHDKLREEVTTYRHRAHPMKLRVPDASGPSAVNGYHQATTEQITPFPLVESPDEVGAEGQEILDCIAVCTPATCDYLEASGGPIEEAFPTQRREAERPSEQPAAQIEYVDDEHYGGPPAVLNTSFPTTRELLRSASSQAAVVASDPNENGDSFGVEDNTHLTRAAEQTDTIRARRLYDMRSAQNKCNTHTGRQQATEATDDPLHRGGEMDACLAWAKDLHATLDGVGDVPWRPNHLQSAIFISYQNLNEPAGLATEPAVDNLDDFQETPSDDLDSPTY